MSTDPMSFLDIPKTRDPALTALADQRTAPAFSSRSRNRLSSGSTQTGESSTAASNRDSSTSTVAVNDSLYDHEAGGTAQSDINRHSEPVRDGRSSHRSHRSKGSGGFLLSNIFEQPSGSTPTTSTTHHRSHHSTSHDHKGKAAVQSPEKKHMKRGSNVGVTIGSSPLAKNVENAGTKHDSVTPGVPGDAAGASTTSASAASGPATLDVDAAQIVNLALNLSESRRNAARRASSTQSAISTGESAVGGSLRQHLQQQRRISRTVSPKPERGGRGSVPPSRVASGQRLSSPLHAAFDQSDQDYRYHFSASTLARAQKAKEAIELMAQYRRLLQYVPPLRPQGFEKVTTAGSINNSLGLPRDTMSASRSSSYSGSIAPIGRPFNPLQYIRNRKIRARERKAIDGDAQGFADVEKVTAWVDEVSERATLKEYRGGDFLLMPSFSDAADTAISPNPSPQSGQGRAKAAATRVKRPRIDWETHPADMIAEVFWLEQEDNKKIIEDNRGRKIFPPTLELQRPMSRRGAEVDFQGLRGVSEEKEEPNSDPRVDIKLPEFKSIRGEHDSHLDTARDKSKHKLREVSEAARVHHSRPSSTSVHRQFRKSQSRSDTDFSESEAVRRLRRSRSGTDDNHDRGRGTDEKQVSGSVRRESKGSRLNDPNFSDAQQVRRSIENPALSVNDGSTYSGSKPHSRAGSVIAKDSISRRNSGRHGSSGRGSLDVLGASPRGSLDGLDTTAPNSPETGASRLPNGFYPSIAMDLSPPMSRILSPTPNTLSKVKSIINPFHDHSHSRNQSRGRHEDFPSSIAQQLGTNEEKTEIQEALDRRNRSLSPTKRVQTSSSEKGHKSTKSGSFRRNRGSEESSGIKGLFKGTRGPVARVTDFIWKKDAPRARGSSSGMSTDESDAEDHRRSQSLGRKTSLQDGSPAVDKDDVDGVTPGQKRPSYISEMPVFTSPFDGRGRPLRARSDETVPVPANIDAQHRAREERRKASRAYLLEPTPRIDIQGASPPASPEITPADLLRRGSSVSDIDSRRPSFVSGGVHLADSRLNAILGLPNRGRHDSLPVTGLASLETCHENSGPASRDGGGRWSISDCGVPAPRGPMTKREIARVRALMLSSGVKAKEISRRATELRDMRLSEEKIYADIAYQAQTPIKPIPRAQEHIVAARILSDDIQFSARMWQATADAFCNGSVEDLLTRMTGLQNLLANTLTHVTRKAADDADEVSRDLVMGQTLKVKKLMDQMELMMRRRRRKFRWLRRGGWVLVEWALVGVMWYVWFLVVMVRIVVGCFSAVIGGVKWLFWL